MVANLLNKDEVDTLGLLSLITQNPELKNLRFSLILSQEEMDILPIAYEKGLFCHFEKPFNRDSLKKELANFSARLEQTKYNHTKLSATYLRQYLVSKNAFQTQISLEKDLLKVFPADLDILCYLAQAQHACGETVQAKTTLRHACALGEKAKNRVEELATSLFGSFDLGQTKSDDTLSLLDINHCVIIDEDAKTISHLKKSLGELGVKKFSEFNDGETAWESLAKMKPEELNLIIQEWRIPKLTGPLLLQRIRKDFVSVPIVCISKEITDKDLPLVKELGLNSILAKPLNSEDLTLSVISVIQEDRLPSELESLKMRMRHLLSSNQYEEALKLKEQFHNSNLVDKGQKAAIEAEFAYFEKDYMRARRLCVEAISGKADSLIVLNLLGKVFMQQKNFDAALNCFEKAQALSPLNVQRLCDMAIAASEAKDDKRTEAALMAAERLDAKSPIVGQTKAGIIIAQGKTSEARTIMEGLDSIAEVISHLNNKAISLSLSGKAEEGIQLYHKTLEAIPDNKPSTIAAVAYNLALAYTRSDQLPLAISTLENIKLDSLPPRISQKISSLLARLKKAQEKGEKMSLKVTKEDSTQTESTPAKKYDQAAILASISADAGDICCFKIFVNPEPAPERAKSLLESSLRFNKRDAIERSVASGVERTQKASS